MVLTRYSIFSISLLILEYPVIMGILISFFILLRYFLPLLLNPRTLIYSISLCLASSLVKQHKIWTNILFNLLYVYLFVLILFISSSRLVLLLIYFIIRDSIPSSTV